MNGISGRWAVAVAGQGAGRLVGTALLCAGVLVSALAFQGSRGIWEPDEGRYTNVAIQMLRSGDFVVPAFNDEVTHFSKPPLTYWALAASMAIFGRNEWAVRLPNSLAFALTALVVFFLARRITPQRPWLPPIVYSTFLATSVAANVVTTDTLLTLCEAVAVLGFVEWWSRRGTSGARGCLLIMWGGFGLAFLTKGPPGLLPLLAVIALAASAGGPAAVGALFRVEGLGLFVVVGLGWYAFVSTIYPELIGYYLHHELVHRVASDVFHRNPQWYGALGAYLPMFVVGTLPWTPWLLRRLPAVRAIASREWWRQRFGRGSWTPLLILWLGLPMLVFTLSRSRLPLYVLPLFVPLALATGLLLPGSLLRLRRAPILLAVWVAVLLGVRAASSLYHTHRDARAISRTIAAALDGPPSEVVFVDSRPIWGISLHLDAEVEVVTTWPQSGEGSVAQVAMENLAAELAACEPRVVLVVPPGSADAVATALARIGRPYRVVGALGKHALVAGSGEDIVASQEMPGS